MRESTLSRISRTPSLMDLLRENVPECYAGNGRSERFIRFIETTGIPLDRALGAYRKTIEGIQERKTKDGNVKHFRYAAKTVNSHIDAAVERIHYALANSPHLSVAQKYAVEQNLKNQKKRIRIASVAVPESKLLSPREIETLLAGIPDPVLACMARVLADTALRISELLNILLTDIQSLNAHYRLRILGKGSKERFVSIEKEPIDRARKLCKSTVYLFEKEGKRYTRELVTMNLRNTSLKIIGRPVGAHVFRHSLLSYLATTDKRIKAVAELAGHSSAKTTLDLYVHDSYTHDELQELLEKRKDQDI